MFFNCKRVFFLELFDLGPPSFAKMHIYVYIANLHGEVGQNILNWQNWQNWLKSSGSVLLCLRPLVLITGKHN